MRVELPVDDEPRGPAQLGETDASPRELGQREVAGRKTAEGEEGPYEGVGGRGNREQSGEGRRRGEIGADLVPLADVVRAEELIERLTHRPILAERVRLGRGGYA